MAKYTSAQELREYEGRESKLGKEDTAVFDKARSVNPNRAVMIGLSPALGRDTSFLFRTTEADKRPATRVPFHEPHPDRIAISDAIRARIEAEERRAAERLAAYNAEIMLEPRKSNGRRAIPVVENPDTSRCCTESEASVKGERNGRILYWRTARDADNAFGSTKTARRIENALMPGKRLIDPYGWRWSRVGEVRPGRRRSGARHL